MAIVRKDKVLAGYNGNLESVHIYDNAGSARVATTNGVFVVVEGKVEGEREVVKARLGAEADADKEILLVHNAEVMYDERKYRIADYVIDEDVTSRAYRLAVGDIITLTVDLFDGDEPVEGDLLGIKADGKIGVIADADANKVVFEFFEDANYELSDTQKAIAVKVIKA